VLPRTKYARSDDVRIAYQITGDGPFDVVWAPGTMSHLDLDWEIPRRALFFERFSQFCRLMVLPHGMRRKRRRIGGKKANAQLAAALSLAARRSRAYRAGDIVSGAAVCRTQQMLTMRFVISAPCWERAINLIPAFAEVTPLTFSGGGTRAPQWRRLASRASSLCPVSKICGSYLPDPNR